MTYLLRVEEPSLAAGLLIKNSSAAFPSPAEAREAPIA